MAGQKGAASRTCHVPASSRPTPQKKAANRATLKARLARNDSPDSLDVRDSHEHPGEPMNARSPALSDHGFPPFNHTVHLGGGKPAHNDCELKCANQLFDDRNRVTLPICGNGRHVGVDVMEQTGGERQSDLSQAYPASVAAFAGRHQASLDTYRLPSQAARCPSGRLSTCSSPFFANCQSQSSQSLTFLTEIKSDWGDTNKTAVASEKSSQLATHRRKAAHDDDVALDERFVSHRYENFLIGSRRQSSRNSTPTVPAVSSMV